MDTTHRERELEMLLWFAQNELYYDGSNVSSWLPELKEKLEEVFGIKLLTDFERKELSRLKGK
jgi:hypothetical protein